MVMGPWPGPAVQYLACALAEGRARPAGMPVLGTWCRWLATPPADTLAHRALEAVTVTLPELHEVYACRVAQRCLASRCMADVKSSC